MATDNAIYTKSYCFANDIVRCYKALKAEHEYNLSNQMERSGTAIGALVREAQFAQSTADFINKMYVALKEANETQYWLNLLHDNKYINDEHYINLINQCRELTAMLVAIIKTSKSNLH